jgi:paraquat-inducible protein B
MAKTRAEHWIQLAMSPRPTALQGIEEHTLPPPRFGWSGIACYLKSDVQDVVAQLEVHVAQLEERLNESRVDILANENRNLEAQVAALEAERDRLRTALQSIQEFVESQQAKHEAHRATALSADAILGAIGNTVRAALLAAGAQP